MLSFTSLAILTAAVPLLPSALATFDASANTNMAVYWGQGSNQNELKYFCDDDNIDIIPIGFVNIFPDQSGGLWPGTNFGNQCGSETFKYPNGSSSLLLSHCPSIGPDITYCQSKGKKILLSLGGAYPTDQHLDSETSAKNFAEFLWEAFGPSDASSSTPRPFGDAVVDGFDFDIENSLTSGEDPGDYDRGYATMVNRLRTLFVTDTSKQYYISAAPQCIVPDEHLADAIEKSPFDFLFVQFYNTKQCSARAYFDHSYGGANSNISFGSWVDFVENQSFNKKTKVYLGLPAATSVVYDSPMYLKPSEAEEIITALQCGYKSQFGGVMVYEATASENNQINGIPYADVLKGYLENTGCTKSPSVTSSATLHSTLAVSSTAASSVIKTTSGAISASTSCSSSSLPAISSGSSTQASSRTNGASSSTAAASSSSSVPASSVHGTSTSSVSPFASSSASISLPNGISSSRTPYNNATSGIGSSAPASVVTPTTPAPVSSNTISSPAPVVPVSTEYTSLTTYTTVTSCPVTTTKVSGGTTSIIVETSVITSTITTCPRCSEKTKHVSFPAPPSIAPASPSKISTTGPVSFASVTTSPSSISSSIAPGGSNGGQQPKLTTYTSTELVSTLTTTCSEPTTFSLSSGGKIYTATANETLTITECAPCTLTHKSVGHSVPTNFGSPFGSSGGSPVGSPFGGSPPGGSHADQPIIYHHPTMPGETGKPGKDSVPGYLNPSHFFGHPKSSGSGKEGSGSSSQPAEGEGEGKGEGSSGSTPAGSGSGSSSSSSSKQSGSEAEGGSGSSGSGSSGASNAGSQSSSDHGNGNGKSSSSSGSSGASHAESESEKASENGESSSSGGSSGAGSNAGSQSSSHESNGGSSSSSGSSGASHAESESEKASENGASSPSGGSPGATNAGSQSSPNGGSGSGSAASSGSSTNGATTSSSEKSTAEGSQSEANGSVAAGSSASSSAGGAGAPPRSSGVSGAHHPIVTMEIIPIPKYPEQNGKAGSSSSSSNGGAAVAGGEESQAEGGENVGISEESVQQGGEEGGSEGGSEGESQGGSQSEQQNGQQSNEQIGQQSGTSGQQGGSGTSSPSSFTNGTAPAGTANPSGTAVAIPGSSSSSSSSSSQNGGNSSPQEFKGAASPRLCGGLFGVMAASVVAIVVVVM